MLDIHWIIILLISSKVIEATILYQLWRKTKNIVNVISTLYSCESPKESSMKAL